MLRPFTTRNDHKFDVKSKTVVGGRSRLTESALDMFGRREGSVRLAASFR